MPESGLDLLTRKDVAALLKCSLRTVDNLLNGEPVRIPSYKIGKSVRVDPTDVDAYLSSCYRNGAA